MSWVDFAVVTLTCAATILVCRVAPIFLLKGRELPASAQRVLGLIPAATFAALIANDLLSPGMFDEGLWPAGAPLVSAALVFAVGYTTKSLVWCIVTGVASFALLVFIA